MGFIKGLLNQIEYGDYESVKKFGEVYSEKIGNEQFTMSAQLLKGPSDGVLRLDLKRRWGSTGDRTLIDLHFRKIGDIRVPIGQLLQDVSSRTTEPDIPDQMSGFGKLVTSAAAGRIIRSYGRIDHQPKDVGRFRLQLFLSWNGQRYWLLLCQGEGALEWTKWPVGVAKALDRLCQQFEAKR